MVDVPANFECVDESSRNAMGSSVSAQEFLLQSSLVGDRGSQGVAQGQMPAVSGVDVFYLWKMFFAIRHVILEFLMVVRYCADCIGFRC